MSTRIHYPLIICFSLMMMNCKSQQPITTTVPTEKVADSKATKSENKKQNQLITISEQNITPNHARVIATVVSINPMLMPGDTSSPCSKAPCKARLRINEVMGYGAGFGNPLSSRDTIYVNFMFTTHATTMDLFPVLNEYYPGVKVGDRIQTDLESRLGFGGEGSVSYFVYGYKVR